MCCATEHAIDRSDLIEDFLYQTWGTFPLRRKAEDRRRSEQRRRSHLWLNGARVATSVLACVGGFLLLRDLDFTHVDGLVQEWQRSLRRR